MKIGHNPEASNARPPGPAGKPQPKFSAPSDAAGKPAAPGAAAGAAAQPAAGAAAREQAVVSTRTQQAQTAPAATQARAAQGVSVTLTASARSTGVQGSSADFDAGKVKAVKAAIEKGTFKVDANAIADRLLANAYETLVRSRG